MKQVVLFALAGLCLLLAIQELLRQPTLILPPWFLVILFTPFLVGVSIGVSLLLNRILSRNYSVKNYTAILIMVLSLAFVAFNYHPTYQVELPESYAGEVTLFLSKEPKNEFKVNQYGIGYITEESYQNGFRPEIIQKGQDISHMVKGYSTGSIEFGGVDGKTIGPYSYLTFVIPGVIASKHSRVKFDDNLINMIEAGLIDTTKMIKR